MTVPILKHYEPTGVVSHIGGNQAIDATWADAQKVFAPPQADAECRVVRPSTTDWRRARETHWSIARVLLAFDMMKKK